LAVGLFVRPGPFDVCGVVVACPGGTVGRLAVGVTVGVELGTAVGVPACRSEGETRGLVVALVDGVGVAGVAAGSVARGVGATVGSGFDCDRTPSGTGTSGVCTVGPPTSVLASSATYPAAGTTSSSPARRANLRRRPDGSTKTACRAGGVTSAEV
jgi:hypothetical protein